MQQQLELLASDEANLQSDLATLRQRHDELTTLTEELQGLVDSISLLEREVLEYDQETARLTHAVEIAQAEVSTRAVTCSSCDQHFAISGLPVEDLQRLVDQKVSRCIRPYPQLLTSVQEVEYDSMMTLLEDLKVFAIPNRTMTHILNFPSVSRRARECRTYSSPGQTPESILSEWP